VRSRRGETGAEIGRKITATVWENLTKKIDGPKFDLKDIAIAALLLSS
jgi:hypothetical protein